MNMKFKCLRNGCSQPLLLEYDFQVALPWKDKSMLWCSYIDIVLQNPVDINIFLPYSEHA